MVVGILINVVWYHFLKDKNVYIHHEELGVLFICHLSIHTIHIMDHFYYLINPMVQKNNKLILQPLRFSGQATES